MSALDPLTAPPVKEGDVLAGKYKVEKVLGVGGMGVVVAATQVELRQRVALKFLLPQAAMASDLVERFLREARNSVRLKSDHIAKVSDVGRLENGCPYIVMEYLEGQDLSAEIKEAQGPMGVELVATYLLHACEGLAEAHAQGIVHRDLKPGNLFVTKASDGEPLLKVLDFGISKSLDPMPVEEQISSLTKTEMLLGSPLYMSPEQLRSSKHVDARADIWALGAIAYEMLTCRVPFEADSLLELCWKVAQENAKPLLELRADVPEPLAKAVMRCLEKDVALRWGDVGALAVAVEPFAAERERGAAARAVGVLKTSMRRTDPQPKEVLPIPPAAKVPSSSPPSAGKNDSGAWGTTQREAVGPAAKTRRILVAAALGVAALAALGVAASRSTGEPPASGPPANSSANTLPPAPTPANSLANTLPPATAPANSAANSLPNTLANSSPNSLANTLPPASTPANSSANTLPPASAPANSSANTLPPASAPANSSANTLAPGGGRPNSSANSLPGGTAGASAGRAAAKPKASASAAAPVDQAGFIKVRE